MEFFFTFKKNYSINIAITSTGNSTKWSNTLKQFVSNNWRIVSVFFDRLMILIHKGLLPSV